MLKRASGVFRVRLVPALSLDEATRRPRLFLRARVGSWWFAHGLEVNKGRKNQKAGIEHPFDSVVVGVLRKVTNQRHANLGKALCLQHVMVHVGVVFTSLSPMRCIMTDHVHLRHNGRSYEWPLSDLRVTDTNRTSRLKRAVERKLDLRQGELDDYSVDRPSTGHVILRPQAVYG